MSGDEPIVADHGRGLAAAVALCIAEQDELVADADRDLFGDAPAPERGPGRPKGAPNRVTEQQAEVIRRSGVSPLAYLASVWRDEKVERKHRVAAAVAALPYVHKRQPIAVDLTNHERITLVIGDVQSDLPAGTDAGDFSLVIEGSGRVVENGGNPPSSDAHSNGSHSNGSPENGGTEPNSAVPPSAPRSEGARS